MCSFQTSASHDSHSLPGVSARSLAPAPSSVDVDINDPLRPCAEEELEEDREEDKAPATERPMRFVRRSAFAAT
jgi:hypothetical protein